ncbi:MAG: biotin/lipoyl-containing protein [Halieaceae bacterium]|jgi:acetyl-CoA carboxylase biotin carboxyl carrier protein|nr:biotin/lipoyl-containing protein [Halieaceae bacterium]
MKEPTADDIKTLIENFEGSQWKELSLQVGDFRIFLSRDPNCIVPGWLKESQPAGQHGGAPRGETGASQVTRSVGQPLQETVAAPAAAATEADIPAGAVAVRAPNLGIFYRAPKPGAPPYVAAGDQVEPDTEVCLIEVMKLFTPVTAGVRGEVVNICIEDGEMVEHGQALFHIKPKA